MLTLKKNDAQSKPLCIGMLIALKNQTCFKRVSNSSLHDLSIKLTDFCSACVKKDHNGKAVVYFICSMARLEVTSVNPSTLFTSSL